MSVVVAVASTLAVGLLHSIFGYCAEKSGKILEVEHRRENKISWNGDLTCIQLRVALPANLKVSDLYLEMKPRCWKFGAFVAVREFSAMNFPSANSLIVFGMSDVLCLGNVLDELLKEVGVTIPNTDQHRSLEAVAAAKVKALAGKPSDGQRRIIKDKLVFTKGARFVCRALKENGFRLALLTNTGGLAMATAVKEQLGIDYAIAPEYEIDEEGKFTGRYKGLYAGDSEDMMIRKFDFLQLLAHKENIERRDVIVVGRFMEGLPEQLVHDFLDSYGPQIYYDAKLKQNLVVLLYLLGYSGLDVRALQTKYEQEGSVELAEDAKASDPRDFSLESMLGRHCVIRIHSLVEPSKGFAELLKSLEAFQQQLKVLSIHQITIASGDAFLGLEMVQEGSDMDAPLKELLFKSHQLGMELDWDTGDIKAQISTRDGSGAERYVLTLMQKPELTVTSLAAILEQCKLLDVECLRLDRLSGQNAAFRALRITIMVELGKEEELRSRLLAKAQENNVDIALQRAGIERWGRRLIVFDLDHTLIKSVGVDEMLIAAGHVEEAQAVTARRLNGELGHYEALCHKAALLGGQKVGTIMSKVREKLVYTEGAKKLCQTLKRLGYKTALISGGVLPVAREVQQELGLDYVFANTLEIDHHTGNVTGRLVGPVVEPDRKRCLLSMIADVEGCKLSQTVAVGAGAGDIPMLKSAGLGIAFCGRDKIAQSLADVADVQVNSHDLSTVLYLLGLGDTAVDRLGVADDGGSIREGGSPF